MTWRTIPISLTELCIDTTLRCGQSFRWKKSSPDTYSCAIHGRLISLRQDSAYLHYCALLPPPFASTPEIPLTPRTDDVAENDLKVEEDDDQTEEFLRHYLNLGPDLGKLYETWAARDANFRKKAPRFTGVRILKQDAWEALVGFICSSNNNIARISQMMEKLCAHYGPLIGHIDDTPYYDMPAPSALTNPRVEGHLRDLGFGYRAKYLYQTAVMITREDDGWLDALRNPESPVLGQIPRTAGEMLPGGRAGYREAHEKLLALQGVGPKVADCVCLMGLGWGEAVPVDTHVWQIAQRDYKFGKGKHRSLTKATYDAVGDHFRSLWGKEAGWAHSVLFTADLRAFSERLKVEVKEEDDEIKIETVTANDLGNSARIVKKEESLARDPGFSMVHVKEESFVVKDQTYDMMDIKRENGTPAILKEETDDPTVVVKAESSATPAKQPREARASEHDEDASVPKAEESSLLETKLEAVEGEPRAPKIEGSPLPGFKREIVEEKISIKREIATTPRRSKRQRRG